MIIKRRRNIVPGLNTTSTADISFMLLIFFLVTTSMDVDKGLSRILPPADMNKKEQAATNVEKENLMTLKLMDDNKILMDGEPVKVENIEKRVVDFVERRGSRHLISLESEREADYEVYFKIQNQLVLAYSKVRDRKAKELYHREYERLNSGQKRKLDEICPQRIAESYANASKGTAVDSIKARRAKEEGGALK